MISLAYGGYIFFLGADESMPLQAIGNVISNPIGEKTDTIGGTAKQCYNYSNENVLSFPFIPTWIYNKTMDKSDLVKSNMSHLCGSLTRQEFLLSLNIKFSFSLYKLDKDILFI